MPEKKLDLLQPERASSRLSRATEPLVCAPSSTTTYSNPCMRSPYMSSPAALSLQQSCCDPTQRSRLGILPLFFLVGIAYGYGVIVETNARFDRSTGIPYTAIVQNKQISSGRSTTYELELSPWGPKARTNELDVFSSTYKKIQTGQTVQLRLKMGALGVHWYYLDDW